MPHAYCTECQAQVTVRMGRCLLDHPVDPSTISDKRGRRVSRHPRREHKSLVEATSGRDPDRRRPSLEPRPSIKPEFAPPTTLVAKTAIATRAPQEQPTPTPGPDRYPIVPAHSGPGAGPSPQLPPAAIESTATREASQPAGAVGTLEQTRYLIADLWNTAEFERDVRDLTPTDELMLDARGWARRLGAVLLVVGVALLGWGIYSLWNSDTGGLTEQAAREELVAAIDSLEPTLADLADGVPLDPVATPLAIDRAALAARELFGAAASIDDPGARRKATADAQIVLEVTEALIRVDSYQAAITPVLDGPFLAGTPDEIQAAEAFAGWQSEFENVLAVLPTGAETAGVDTLLTGFKAWFEPWKQEMLDGLRDERDPSSLLVELDVRLADLRASVDAMLRDTSASARSMLTELG